MRLFLWGGIAEAWGGTYSNSIGRQGILIGDLSLVPFPSIRSRRCNKEPQVFVALIAEVSLQRLEVDTLLKISGASLYPMRRACLLLFVTITMLTVVIVAPSSGCCSSSRENRPSRVLVLSSFHPGQPWGDDFIDTFKTELQGESRQVEFYIEYMDSERHHHMAHLEQLVSIYEYRYAYMQPDCIAAFGDEAFEFLRRHAHSLFGDVPVVFAGVSDDKRDRLGGYDNFTGGFVAVAAESTLSLIQKLHPAASRFVLISDTTGESRRVRAAVEKAIEALKPLRLEVWESVDFDTGELFSAAGALGADSVVLFAGCSVDRQGLYFSSRWCLKRLADVSRVPIYGLQESYLGNGIVGGELISAHELGALSAHLTSEVLDGKGPSSERLSTLENRVFSFDARQLDKFHIDEGVLPVGAKVLFREIGFFDRYRVQIWVAIGVIVAQMISILFLVVAITRRGRAERALQRTEETLDMAVKGADLGLWRLDLEGNIVTLNGRWAEILGYPAKEKQIPYEQWVEMVHPEERAQFVTALERHVKGDISFFRAEHRIQAQDGTTRWIVTRGKVVVRENLKERSSIRLAGTHLDISEQRAAEAQRNELRGQLSQRQRIESIGELAGGIAHDFNNLLSPILGYTDMALSEMDPSAPLFSDLLEIRTAGKRAKDLVHKLLTFGRRQILSPEFLNLNTVTEDLRSMLTHLVRADVSIHFGLSPDLWTVYADPVHVQQILVNLVVNACDAMPNGGRLAIQTMNTRALPRSSGIEDGQEYVILRVEDTGTGMTEAVREKIFAPFFTTKEKGHGTGLGLATVYSVVKQHDGHIFVDTESGKGSRFDVYLPRSNGTVVTRSEVTRRAVGPESGKTVLLAEDNDAVRKLVVDILSSHGGYHVLFAADGAEALDVLRAYTGDIHLVLTDVIMPRMNGRALQRSVASLRPGTPVVFMSGYSDNVLGSHGVRDKDIRLLNKPFSAEELLVFVESALSSYHPGGLPMPLEATGPV